MDYRYVGRSGLQVSLVGLGCNMLGARVTGAAAGRLVHEALDLGVTLFDVADMYGEPGGEAERVLGAALGERRSAAVVASKAGFAPADRRKMGASRRYLIAAVEASLRRLGTDYIDLYQIHTPDPHTPIEETLRALQDLIQAGKIRYAGASNLTAWQAVDAGWTARHLGLSGYISVQNEYNLLNRGHDAELLPALAAAGMAMIPYFPLASGMLTGKYRPGAKPFESSRLLASDALAKRFRTADNAAAIERLAAFVEARGRSLVELAFAWLAAKPGIASIIAGATSVEQLRQNLTAVEWRMSPEEIATAERLAATD